MKLSVELTLYPLQDEYLNIIKQTIDKLNTYSDIDISTFPTATILIGDYDKVMAVVNEVVAWSFNNFGKCVFVAKFLPGYEAR
ncbi:YkoF family thiamine/hydroxymethylpyrimidine-binding protein [Teredinibacter haidensis]|uniref:YkoF family thiamine/hydroxymethylpyrimidine-binding protein n=1 Tax=Teredinibacter haidensis TaxID=2731755 RepID=UPI0009490A67|nr:YkoF family thiamine/hydroxymethylpyrimidine-binding protein [Teredinibacter haidensis]